VRGVPARTTIRDLIPTPFGHDAHQLAELAQFQARERGNPLAAPSKNYRYSANVQIAIDADTRLVIATGDPQPGNRNDCTVYRSFGINQQLADRPVMTGGGYQGNPEVIMPFRKPRDGTDLPDWKEDLDATHRKIRARVARLRAAVDRAG
jgi:hypothetical protein